ncbi:MAG: hypothetical protein CMA12_00015 [Euryarchaeota archaeon]|nr:hypothetical protein [Euryarchaeota archaeon]
MKKNNYTPSIDDIFISTVSRNTIEAANKFSKKHKRNVVLIASLNQISTYEKSYLYNSFDELNKKKISFNNKNLFIGRDHFGINSIKNFKILNKNKFLTKNIKIDLLNNLDFIHFDMANDINYMKSFNKIIPLILKLNKKIIIEIGLDLDGSRTSNSTFIKLKDLQLKYSANIKFITFQTGTKLFNNSNKGKVDYKNIRNNLLANDIKIYFKEHNSDFKNKNHFIKLKKYNFTFNIGPEFAYYENKHFMNKIKKIVKKENLNKFYSYVLSKKLWKKWCLTKLSNNDKLLSSLHYFYNGTYYLDLKEQLDEKIEFDKEVINQDIKLLENKFIF